MANLLETIQSIGKDIKALQAKGVQINGVKYGEYQRGTVKRSQMELVSGTGNSSNFKVKFGKPFSKVPQIRFSATSTLRATATYNVYEVTKDYFMFTQNSYGAEPTVEYEAFTDPEIVVAETSLPINKLVNNPSFKEGYIALETESWLQIGDLYTRGYSYSFEQLPFDFNNRVLAAGINTEECYVVIPSAPYSDKELQSMIDKGWVITPIPNIKEYINLFNGNQNKKYELYSSFKMLTNQNIKLTQSEVDTFDIKTVVLSSTHNLSIDLQPVQYVGYPNLTLFDKTFNKLSLNYNVIGNIPLK